MTTLKSAVLASLLSTAGSDGLHSAPALAPHLAPVHQTTEPGELASLADHIRGLLQTHDVDAVVTSRVKSEASIRAKMARKGVSWHEIYDRLALRIHVADEAACYRALAVLQGRWAEVPGERDDYIAAPKANGYQSLHTAMHTPLGVAELQIRTHEMHERAEHGEAAHWRYKLATAA